jgi:DNA primase
MSSALDMLFSLAPELLVGSKPSTNFIMVNCPFHGENTPSMAISTWKPVYFCHGCKCSGHLAQLLRKYGLSREMTNQLLPQTRYVDEKGMTADGKAVTVAAKIIKGVDPFRGKYILEEEILDDYRLMPLQLKNAGFKPSTLRHFEVGWDQKNLRITFPLRTVFGELVGISGRTVIDGLKPRYKIYDKELKERTDFHIPESYSMEEQKSSILWHAHVVRPLFFLQKNEGHDAFVISEGFKACMWTWQSGYLDSVALVGSYLTPSHAELIARATRKVTLFLDNNIAGWRGTKKAGNLLIRKGVEVNVACYPDDREQPDGLSDSEVIVAVDEQISFREWLSIYSPLIPEDPKYLLKKLQHLGTH